MTGRQVIVAGVALLAIGCNPDQRRRFALPSSPTETAPPPIVVQPPTRQFPPFEITTIAVGDIVTRMNRDAPECIGELGWPCLYFRFAAPRTGTLEVALSYAWGTQGNQGVDVSLHQVGTFREFWAQSSFSTGPRWQTVLMTDVVEGTTYDITLWYTFPNLAYELRTSMK